MYLKNILCALLLMSFATFGYAADKSTVEVISKTEPQQLAVLFFTDQEALVKVRFLMSVPEGKYRVILQGYSDGKEHNTVVSLVALNNVDARVVVDMQGVEVITADNVEAGFDNIVVTYGEVPRESEGEGEGKTAQKEEPAERRYCAKQLGAKELEDFDPPITTQCTAEQLAVAEKLLAIAKNEGVRTFQEFFGKTK